MKKHFLLLVLSVISMMAFAHQATPQWTGVNSDSPASFRTQLISSSESSVKVNVQVPGFYTTNVTTPHGEAKVILLPKAVNAVNAGEPDLPTLGIPTIIGDHARMSVRIIDAQYMDFEGIEIAPFKGNFSRQIDPADVPYTYGECYSQDAFFPANNVGLFEPYIIRDFRGQNMIVRPFAYNPITKTLRVYYNMTVEMYKVDDNGVNTMQTNRSNVIKMDPDFKSLYQRHFINYEAAMNRYTAVDEEGDLLIICYGNYMSAMTDFVNWKKTRGVNTTIVNASTAGSTYSAIQTYIKNQYNANNNLTHVLLVGDVAQIPGYTYSGGGSSYGGKGDNAYGQIVGNDIYNDVFVGRFSASSVAQVTTQVNRVITYERDLTTSASWLNIGQGISRKEGGSGHNNEDDYQHINNIRTDLLNYGYTTVYQRYANLSGYTATSAQISSDINSGVGIINYANHGQETAWGANASGYVYYANSHVNALTNDNKLPFIFSVACLVGKYDYSSGDCFAESWMHATNGSNPTGAIGALMSYISQPWIPPMWAQDECVDILVESYSSNIKHTWGGVSVNGLMGIFDHYSTSEQSAVGTYQAWILYGDPSLMLRTKTPQAMTVSHSGSIDATATSYTVNVTNGNGARATITNANHDILGSATVSNNKAIISLTAPGANASELTLCVFGYNKVTYLGTITVGGGGSSTTYYTVSATASPTAGGSITGAGTYAQGTTCTLTATPASGYEFTKWTKNGTQVSTNATYSFTVNANASYVANFSEVVTPDPGTATEVTIGSGSSTNAYLPTYAYYNYSLTEQIYTAAEIGQAGTITAISFKVGNSKSTTRNVDVYLKTTTKTAFTSKTGWETLSSSNKVYSGNVTFNASGWTTINLSTPFVYDGTSNLVVGVDDNTGSYVSSSSNSPKFYVYSTSANRALRIYNDNTNYNPASPSSYSGSYVTSNNQIMFSMNSAGGTPQVNTYTITASASPTAGGTVSGAGTYDEGQTVTLTATAASGYTFSKWTKNGTQVSTNAVYSFTASADAAYVAVFTQNSYAITASANPTAGGTVSGAGTYTYGSTATLTATAKSGYTFTNWTKNGTQVSTNATYSFTVTSAAAYVANFTQQQVTTYYDVTVAEVPNGTVTSNKTSAAAGETVTLTVSPNSGCTFYTWVVYKTGDVNTTVTVNNNSFTMPSYNVTVVAVIKPNGNAGTGGEVTIGSGSSTNAYLPTYAYYKYSLTEQIYTAAEIGQAGTITAISFKVGNSKSTTRNVDVYLKTTTKTAFTSKTGWETLSSSNKVYSGNVTFNASGWTTITLTTPFVYNGTSNLVVGMDDNTGSYVSSSSNSPKFYVYSTGANRALRIYNDNTNYNPASPNSYSGSYVTSNNQIIFSMSGAASSGSTEVLVVTPKTMSGFTYVVGNGPSEVQTFAAIGADLSSDITLTAPSGYEISTSANSGFGSTVTLTGSREGIRGTQTWGFEGSMDSWTTIDKDGDGYNWQLASVLMSGYSISAHGGSDMLSSESYNKTTSSALTPDNWLVSPQVTLGGTFSMYACAQDANYAAEHFGIYVSTGSSTNTSSFVKLGEWTISAKGDRTQGSWNQYTVDLSAYAGQMGYIAVRHFNCTDQFYLNVDDFTLTYDETPVNPDPSMGGAEFLKANVYVRLKSGLSQGTYNGTLTAATTGVNGTVTLNGAVTGSRDASMKNEMVLDIYPNPVTLGENFHIELPKTLNLNEVTIEVFDAVGELVSSERGIGENTIERSITVSPGVYTVRIVDNKNNAYYGKLIVR